MNNSRQKSDVNMTSFSDVKWTSFLVRFWRNTSGIGQKMTNYFRNSSENDQLRQEYVRNSSEIDMIGHFLTSFWPTRQKRTNFWRVLAYLVRIWQEKTSFSDVKWTSFLVRFWPTRQEFVRKWPNSDQIRQELVRNSSEIDHHVRNWSQNDEICLKLIRKRPILSDYCNIAYNFSHIAS